MDDPTKQQLRRLMAMAEAQAKLMRLSLRLAEAIGKGVQNEIKPMLDELAECRAAAAGQQAALDQTLAAIAELVDPADPPETFHEGD